MAIDAMFKQMKADGIDVIGFGAGEPDFDTPDEIKAAGIAAIESNLTRYTPAAGTVELRQAVCDRMKIDCGLEYVPSQVVVSSGAKHIVYLALRVLVNPGDEVILPAPFWVSYYELIRMAGGVPVVVTATEAEDFKLSAEKLAAAITPRTKALILNNPSNPTGMMYGREELEAIAKVCVENELYVISDEIYYGLVYDGLCQRQDRQGHGQLRQPLHRLSGDHVPKGIGTGADRPAGEDRTDAPGVRGAARLHRSAYERHTGGQLYQTGGRLLCDDEPGTADRQDHPWRGDHQRRRVCRRIPEIRPGRGGTGLRLWCAQLCPLVLRHLYGQHQRGTGPSGAIPGGRDNLNTMKNGRPYGRPFSIIKVL